MIYKYKEIIVSLVGIIVFGVIISLGIHYYLDSNINNLNNLKEILLQNQGNISVENTTENIDTIILELEEMMSKYIDINHIEKISNSELDGAVYISTEISGNISNIIDTLTKIEQMDSSIRIDEFITKKVDSDKIIEGTLTIKVV